MSEEHEARTSRLFEHLQDMEERDDLIIAADPPEKEWQCAMCGYVVESTSRPGICPHCNSSDGDIGDSRMVRLFAPREVIGWFE